MPRRRRTPLLLSALLACCQEGAIGGTGADDGEVDAGEGDQGDGDADSDSDSDADADPPDSGAPDPEQDAAVETADERVPIFVAQGAVGRTTISCDDGMTWVGDRSWDREDDAHLCGSTDIVCFADGGSCGQRWYDGECGEESPCDCGHSPGFSKGVVFTGDAFVATWGWGWPGSVRRSRDGVVWESTLEDQSFGGIAYGAGRVVLAARDNFWSSDGGDWTAGATADFSGPNEPVIWSVRRFGFADVDGGRFVAVASGNTDRDVLVSSDGGETWWRPSVVPEGCGEGVDSYGGIVSGNGVIAMIGGTAACRSTDGGETWSMAHMTDDLLVGTPVFTGAEFWAWTHYDHVMLTSPDAETWTATPMETQTSLGAVGFSPETGTLVAVDSVWSGYDTQHFLRSTDGRTWDELAAGSFAPGHPIFYMAFGRAEHSAACP